MAQLTLHDAVRHAPIDVIQSLLVGNINMGVLDGLGHTILHVAVDADRLQVVRLLLDFGMIVDGRSNLSWTPLHMAAKGNHVKIAKLLLKRGADVNALTNEHWTPLHLAVRHGCYDMIDFLFARGAHTHIKNSFGHDIRNQALVMALTSVERLARVINTAPHKSLSSIEDLRSQTRQAVNVINVVALASYNKQRQDRAAEVS